MCQPCVCADDLFVIVPCVKALQELINIWIIIEEEHNEFVSNVQLLGINISTNIYDRHRSDTVRYFYCRTNESLLDFSSISCYIKSRLMSTYCLNLYGSSLWNYSKDIVNNIFVAWRSHA